MAKVSCILHHRGVQLILADSWASRAILVAGKGLGGIFLFLVFLHFHFRDCLKVLKADFGIHIG